LVRRVSQRALEAGRYRFIWDRRDGAGARVSPGLYLVQARSPSHAFSTKVLLID
jgi:hypothetical protein